MNYLNLSALASDLRTYKDSGTAHPCRETFNEIKFPKLSATSIELFKKYSPQEVPDFVKFHERMRAARQEVTYNIERVEKPIEAVVSAAAVAAYASLWFVEVLGWIRWPTAIALSIPAVIHHVGKKDNVPKNHQHFGRALQSLESYKEFFTGASYEEIKQKIRALNSEDKVESKLHKKALKELEKAHSFCV
jgi:hypothetical protein